MYLLSPQHQDHLLPCGILCAVLYNYKGKVIYFTAFLPDLNFEFSCLNICILFSLMSFSDILQSFSLLSRPSQSSHLPQVVVRQILKTVILHTFNLSYYFSEPKISVSVLVKPSKPALELRKFLELEKIICLVMFFWQRGTLLVNILPLFLLYYCIQIVTHISFTPWTSSYCSVTSLCLLSGKIMAWDDSFVWDLESPWANRTTFHPKQTHGNGEVSETQVPPSTTLN